MPQVTPLCGSLQIALTTAPVEEHEPFRSRISGLALLTLLAPYNDANAAPFRIDTDQFAGTNVVNVPGRQVIGGESFTAFPIANEVLSFDTYAFGVSSDSFSRRI